MSPPAIWIAKAAYSTLAWRPIISCLCGDLEAASNWLDSQLRKIANEVPIYLQYSQELVNSQK
jgi:hypothetical protein